MRSGQTFLVAGGAGYIGSHVCKALAESGATPIVLDNFSSGHKHAVNWGPYIDVDLRDRRATLEAVSKYAKDCAGVIHLASSIEVGFGETYPAEFYDNNVGGAFNLLEAMRAHDLSRLIFSSTCATYGDTENMPLSENDTLSSS